MSATCAELEWRTALHAAPWQLSALVWPKTDHLGVSITPRTAESSDSPDLSRYVLQSCACSPNLLPFACKALAAGSRAGVSLGSCQQMFWGPVWSSLHVTVTGGL